jgi:hypothetical protein
LPVLGDLGRVGLVDDLELDADRGEVLLNLLREDREIEPEPRVRAGVEECPLEVREPAPCRMARARCLSVLTASPVGRAPGKLGGMMPAERRDPGAVSAITPW